MYAGQTIKLANLGQSEKDGRLILNSSAKALTFIPIHALEMKTVYFIRHAKSSWSDPEAEDHDRQLNSRGLRDAPFMAKLLKGKGARPDRLVSSSAVRARTTALYFAQEFDLVPTDLQIEGDIYEAFPQDVIEVIRGLDDTYDEICVFGHNPAFTSLVNAFHPKEYLAILPSCGIAKVVATVDRWSEFEAARGQLVALHFPKQYFS